MRALGKPSPLDNEPKLYPDLLWVWEAFHVLTNSRQITMAGPGGIPFEAIDRYADREGVDDFDTFLRLLRAMDATYLKKASDK